MSVDYCEFVNNIINGQQIKKTRIISTQIRLFAGGVDEYVTRITYICYNFVFFLNFMTRIRYISGWLNDNYINGRMIDI